MSNDNSLSLSELNDRIAILQDNLRQLVEQAAGSSGAQNEERTSARIAQQREQLDKLLKARDALSKK
jgi:dsDNA-binding SOS-regulon protein